MLSDEQLIALVQSKSPADLTPEEIRQLRMRLRDSDALRAALLHTLQMESYLAEALGPEPVDPKQVIAWAKQRRIQWWAGATTAISALVAIPLVGLLLLILWATGRSVVNDVSKPIAANHKPAESGEKPKVETESPESSDTGESVSDPSTQPQPTDVAKQETPAAPPMPMPEATPMPMPAAVAPGSTPNAPTIPDGPWRTVFALADEQLPRFADDVFRDFADQQRPSQQDLQTWFTAAPGQPLAFTTESVHPNKAGAIKGAGRLIPPVPVGAALRLKVANVRALRWHAFSGDRGATFYYYPNQNDRIAAYATERATGQALPNKWLHVGSDDYRAWRSEVAPMATFTLYHGERDWQLWRGDIPLTNAPAYDGPSDVTIEGDLAILGIEIVRFSEPPPREWIAHANPFLPPHVAVANDANESQWPAITQTPADLTWNTRLTPGTTLVRQDDGSMMLDARGKKGISVGWFDWKPTVPEELLVHVSNITPGTGIGIVDGDGELYEILQYTIRGFINQRDRQSMVQSRNLDELVELNLPPPTEGATQYAGKEMWLRIVQGCGGFSWWHSADGIHWGSGDQLIQTRYGKVTGLGLVTVGNQAESAPVLKSIVRRPLHGFGEIVRAEIVAKAPVIELPAATGIGLWLTEAIKSKPNGVSWCQWRRACAIRALAAGLPRDGYIKMLDLLVADVCSRTEEPVAPEVRSNLLAAAGLVSINMPRPWFVQANQEMAQGDQEFDFDRYFAARHLSLSLPLAMANRSDQNDHLNNETNVLKALVASQNKPLGSQYVDTIRMFRWHPQNLVLDWAEMRFRGAARPGPYGPTRLRRNDSRAMFVDPTSKTAYDTWSEVTGMLEGNDFASATRMILARPRETSELAWSKDDPDLALSLVDAWKVAIRQSPSLQQSLVAEQARAEIRIRQAIQQGDAEGVKLAAAVFGNVPAAFDGLNWLADSELARGRFELANARLNQARQVAAAIAERDPVTAEGLRARLGAKNRLGESLVGKYVAAPSPGPVSLGNRQLDGVAFEEVLRQLGTTRVAVRSQGASTSAVPPVSHFKVESRAAFDGPFGQAPDQEGVRFNYQWQIDWAARQMSVDVEGGEFYMHNRFALQRWNSADWKKVWQAESPPGDPLRGQDWPMIPMRPTIGPTHIWGRQLIGKSPTLCCWDKATGKLVWQACGEEKHWLVSDPIVRDGRLYGLMVSRFDNQPFHLSLVEWDPLSGEKRKQSNLLTLQETWFERRCAQVAIAGDRMIVALGGASMACDFDGRVRWVRRHEYLPNEADGYAVRQHFAPPVVVGDKVLIAQPAMPTVACLDVDSGTQVWQRIWPDVCRIVGVTENKCVIACRDALAGLELADGATAWRFAIPDPVGTLNPLVQSQLIDNAVMADGKIAVATRVFSERGVNKYQLGMLWLDAASGQPTGEGRIEVAEGEDLRISQPFKVGDKWLAHFATDRNPQRAIIELVPQPGPTFVAGQYNAPWMNHVTPKLWRAGQSVAPGWTWASILDANPSGLVVDAHGEAKVMGIRGTPTEPIALYREIKIAAGSPARLNLRVADEPNSKWTLVIRFNDQIVSTHTFDEKSPNERWKNITADLSRFSGNQGLVSIVAVPAAGHALVYWKNVDLQL